MSLRHYLFGTRPRLSILLVAPLSAAVPRHSLAVGWLAEPDTVLSLENTGKHFWCKGQPLQVTIETGHSEPGIYAPKEGEGDA